MTYVALLKVQFIGMHLHCSNKQSTGQFCMATTSLCNTSSARVQELKSKNLVFISYCIVSSYKYKIYTFTVTLSLTVYFPQCQPAFACRTALTGSNKPCGSSTMKKTHTEKPETGLFHHCIHAFSHVISNQPTQH